MNIRVDEHPDPVAELRRIFDPDPPHGARAEVARGTPSERTEAPISAPLLLARAARSRLAAAAELPDRDLDVLPVHAAVAVHVVLCAVSPEGVRCDRRYVATGDAPVARDVGAGRRCGASAYAASPARRCAVACGSWRTARPRRHCSRRGYGGRCGHGGRCVRCRRRSTDPSSRSRGSGLRVGAGRRRCGFGRRRARRAVGGVHVDVGAVGVESGALTARVTAHSAYGVGTGQGSGFVRKAVCDAMKSTRSIPLGRRAADRREAPAPVACRADRSGIAARCWRIGGVTERRGAHETSAVSVVERRTRIKVS